MLDGEVITFIEVITHGLIVTVIGYLTSGIVL